MLGMFKKPEEKLDEQIFQLRFTSKQIANQAKKAEKEERM